MSGNTNKTDDFLDSVCEKVKCKAMHGDIRAELMSHILEIKERLTGEGKPELEAEDIALQEMGDPQEIGLRLDKIHRPKPEWSVIFLAAAVFLIGCFSFSDLYYQIDPADGTRNVIEFICFALAGLIAFYLIYFFDLKKVLKYSMPIYIVIAIGFSALLLYKGSVNDFLNTYLRFFIIILATQVITLSFAIQYYRNNAKVLIFLLVVTLFSSFAFVYSRGFMWTLILLMIYSISIFMILSKSKLKKSTKIIFAILASLLLTAVLLVLAQQIQYSISLVVTNNFDIMSGITNANFIGKASADKWIPLSGCSLSVMIIKYGYLFTLLVFGAILSLIIRIIQSSISLKDEFYKITSFLIGIIFVFELIVSFYNETGVWMGGQSDGMTLLPFLSQDISSYMLNMILLAVFLSCYRRKNITPSAQLAK